LASRFTTFTRVNVNSSFTDSPGHTYSADRMRLCDLRPELMMSGSSFWALSMMVSLNSCCRYSHAHLFLSTGGSSSTSLSTSSPYLECSVLSLKVLEANTAECSASNSGSCSYTLALHTTVPTTRLLKRLVTACATVARIHRNSCWNRSASWRAYMTTSGTMWASRMPSRYTLPVMPRCWKLDAKSMVKMQGRARGAFMCRFNHATG
jgi:hypothetical protein